MLYNTSMNEIAYHDQHELGLTAPTDQDLHFERRAARAVLRDVNGKVAIMHFKANGSYKLPGGGIDEGEEIIDALHREVREETGYTIDDVHELGLVEENRYFNGMHQISYCFTANVVEYVGTDLTEQEAAEGMTLVWFDTIDDAILAIDGAPAPNVGDNGVGLKMMKLRDIAILRASVGL